MTDRTGSERLAQAVDELIANPKACSDQVKGDMVFGLIQGFRLGWSASRSRDWGDKPFEALSRMLHDLSDGLRSSRER